MLLFGRLRQRIVLKCVPHIQGDYFSSFNQSNHCFLASSLPLPSSLLKRPNRVFSRDVTAVMLVSPTNPLGIERYSYANAFFCFG